MASECGSCKASVHWAVSPKGTPSPINYEPDPEKGNVLLLRPTALGGQLLAVTLSGDLLTDVRQRSEHLFVNHWATCPDRAEWRSKQDAKKEVAGA